MSSNGVKSASLARKSGYLPTLDGWRAIAIILVLLFHDGVHTVGFISTRYVAHWGSVGVQLFFGISGLLICTRLLEEEKLTGGLHLRGFYLRRVMRIQPPALLFLAAVATLMLTGVLQTAWRPFLDALFLVRNYLPLVRNGDAPYPTGHFWSLSVEEHFYLILPAFLLFFKRYRASILLVLTMIAMLWGTYCAWNVHRHLFLWESPRTDQCIFFLLFPSAVAVLLQRPEVRGSLERYLQPIPVIVTAILALLVLKIGNPLTALLPAALIVSTMLHPGSYVGRLLETPPLRFVGKISFGLYLWQQLFITGRYAPHLRAFGILNRYPLDWITVFALATASYYLLERPCMRLGHKLAKPAVEGRPELAPQEDLQVPEPLQAGRKVA